MELEFTNLEIVCAPLINIMLVNQLKTPILILPEWKYIHTFNYVLTERTLMMTF